MSATFIVSAGPYGGTEQTFASDAVGTTLDLPSERAGRVERYEVRDAVDGFGEAIEGVRMAIFVGTVRP